MRISRYKLYILINSFIFKTKFLPFLRQYIEKKNAISRNEFKYTICYFFRTVPDQIIFGIEMKRDLRKYSFTNRKFSKILGEQRTYLNKKFRLELGAPFTYSSSVLRRIKYWRIIVHVHYFHQNNDVCRSVTAIFRFEC